MQTSPQQLGRSAIPPNFKVCPGNARFCETVPDARTPSQGGDLHCLTYERRARGDEQGAVRPRVGHEPVGGQGNPRSRRPHIGLESLGASDLGTQRGHVRIVASAVFPAKRPRRRPESNRCRRLCRPLRSHSATSPRVRRVAAAGRLASGSAVSRRRRCPSGSRTSDAVRRVGSVSMPAASDALEHARRARARRAARPRNERRPTDPGAAGPAPALCQVLSPMWWW